ncbi:MAG: Adenylate kinase [Parcubacteria group bacterium GW2011_GWA2_44_12]|nr:MAG: Adenylate kinase [Parcubacteria group bacterium GW2011_GWA2_44_12]
MPIYKILFIGPQGSGKGTQAHILGKKFALPIITPGNIFREEKAKNTELGNLVASFTSQGQLVPDDITNEIVRVRLLLPEYGAGFILDGYPRNVIQANALNSITALTHVIEIDLPEEETVTRTANRLVCAQGHAYHTLYKPPQQDNICDIDFETLSQRDDDTLSAITKRLEIYQNETKPILERYKQQGIHYYIDGTPPIDDVAQAIENIFS